MPNLTDEKSLDIVLDVKVKVTVQLGSVMLPMRDVLAYLPDYPSLDLRSGDVGAKGRVVLRPATT